MLKKDITNLRFGKLLALDVVSRTRNGHIRWRCICDCGNEHCVLSTHLLSNKILSCGCVKRSGVKHQDWTGVGDISGDYFSALKRHGRKSKSRSLLAFDVTIEYLWELFQNQGGRCALSGIELHFTHKDGIRVRDSQTASLDRIDSSFGYISGNLQWVHKDINLMKNKLDQQLFVNYCKLIAETNLKKGI